MIASVKKYGKLFVLHYIVEILVLELYTYIYTLYPKNTRDCVIVEWIE